MGFRPTWCRSSSAPRPWPSAFARRGAGAAVPVGPGQPRPRGFGRTAWRPPAPRWSRSSSIPAPTWNGPIRRWPRAPGRPDRLVTVTSSAIARSLARFLAKTCVAAKLASISPLTSGVLRELGDPPAVEAAEYTIARVWWRRLPARRQRVSGILVMAIIRIVT